MVTKQTFHSEKRKSFSIEADSPFKTFVDLLQSRALQQPNQLAFTFLIDGKTEHVHTITYAELDLQARAIAASLQAYVSFGERALLLYPSGLEYITAFFGCLYAGVIAIPVYPPKRNQKMSRLKAIVTDANATVVLTVTSLLDNIQERFTKHSELPQLSYFATNNIVNEKASDWQKPDLERHTIAFLQYTSGSTGTPKGVMVSHKNLFYNSEYMKRAFQLTPKSVSVSWLPLFHDMGLILGILQPVYTGFHEILMSPNAFVSQPLNWLKAISHYGATHSGCPNFGYERCLDKIDIDQRNTLDLKSWLTAYCGAEPIRSETLKRFSEFFAPCGFEDQFFYPCYGMAEATLMISGGFVESKPVYLRVQANELERNHIVVADNDSQDIKELVGCGRTWLDGKVVIADPETLKKISSDRVGEILISGASIAQGYWGKPEETKKTFQAYLADTAEGPFLRTGDLGFIKNGEIFITGRLKDLIIIRGRNYYPQDIEFTVENSNLALRPNCGSAFSVEVNGEEQLVIVQEVKREHRRKIDVDEVSRCIRRILAEEHELQVHDIVLIKTTSIPKTSSGKIQRSTCKRKYINGELEMIKGKRQPSPIEQKLAEESKTKVSNINPLAILEDWMKQWISRHTKANVTTEEITSSSQFVDYGLDSVQAVDFASEVEKLFQIRLADGIIFVYPTIRDLSQHILHRLNNNVDKLLVTINNASSEEESTRTAVLNSSSELAKFSSLEDISSEHYQFELLPEYLDFKERFSIYESEELKYPYFKAKEKFAKSNILIDGRELIDFSSFDYLGMSCNTDVRKAAKQAIEKYGTSVSASRIVSGEIPLYEELEKTIASWLGTEDSIVFGHGHATNVYAISSIVGPNDLILHDKCMHNSAMMGGKLSGATIISFAHNDLQALEKILEQKRLHYQRVLILVEGVYSMDGDIVSDLPELIEIKQRHKAWLFIDEAHSIGVLGETGRGVGEHFGIDPSKVDIWMGTISKALGSSGGYIAGCKSLIDYLKHCSPGFLFSTGASPANVAAGLAAIQKVQSEPQLVAQVKDRAQLFLELAKQKGLNTGTSKDSGVVPIILGDSDRAAKLADAANQRGINVFAIGYPAVEFNEARLRFFISSLHTDEQIKYAVDTVAELIEDF